MSTKTADRAELRSMNVNGWQVIVSEAHAYHCLRKALRQHLKYSQRLGDCEIIALVEHFLAIKPGNRIKFYRVPSGLGVRTLIDRIRYRCFPWNKKKGRYEN